VNKTGKIIRIVAIIMLGMTAGMNLLGGIGTTCVAFSSNVGYRLAFKELMDYRWVYQALVVITILIGVAGIWATVKLVRGGKQVFRNSLIILIVGSVFAGVQYFTSMALRGEAAPANVKFYINALTLVIFLAFLIPAIWKKIDFNVPAGKNETKAGAGLAAIITGVLTITVFIWAGPSHTFFGQNWTYVFMIPLLIVGSGLSLFGVWIFGHALADILTNPLLSTALQPKENEG
jgi:hypothetical protein